MDQGSDRRNREINWNQRPREKQDKRVKITEEDDPALAAPKRVASRPFMVNARDLDLQGPLLLLQQREIGQESNDG